MTKRNNWRPAELYERIAAIVHASVPKRHGPEYLIDEIYHVFRTSPTGFRHPFQKWNSVAGRKKLHDILTLEPSAPDPEAELQVLAWEMQVIQTNLSRLASKSKGALSHRKLIGAIPLLARELDLLASTGVPSEQLLDRLEDDAFIGKREHLIRLLAALDAPGKWDQWLSAKTVPDLRGANLSGLDLRSLNLSRARLRGANLSVANLRTGDLSQADLRDCHCRHTDFSYATLSKAKLSGANLSDALFTDADLTGADMRRCLLVATTLNQADLRNADLRGAKVWGTSAWDIRVDESTKQNNLLVVPGLEPLDFIDEAIESPDGSLYVDDIEVAHYVSRLAENPKSIGSVINASSGKIVLLLGRFTGPEQDVLEMLKDALPTFGCVPVVFDFNEPNDRDMIETVAVLAGLSNFVIANLSQPRSTPLEAQLVIPDVAVPFVPLIRDTEQPFSMFPILQRKYSWVLPTVKYRTVTGLRRKVAKEIVEPARLAAAELRRTKHPS